MPTNLTGQFPCPTDRNDHIGAATKSSAFAILYTKQLSLWEHHKEKPLEVRAHKSPAFLMVRRSDYMMGFPGGGIKPGESALDGIIQELKEELGITFIEKDRLELLSRQQFTNVRHIKCMTSCFMAELNTAEFKDVLYNAHKAEHFLAETRGLITVSMEHILPEKPLPFENFLHSPMMPSVRQDMSDFLTRSGIIQPETLRRLTEAGLLPPSNKQHTQAIPDPDFV